LQGVDSRPPFWWIGLFASPGGLLIAAVTVFLVAVLVVLPLVRLLRRRVDGE